MVQQALAESIKVMNEAAPSERVLTLKSLEAFAKAADGRCHQKLDHPQQYSVDCRARCYTEGSYGG